MSDAATDGKPRIPKPRIPGFPLALGAGGLIPFWALALARVTGLPHGLPPEAVRWALAAYAATILSFLGGIRWGAVLASADADRSHGQYVFAVVPQLLGWAALAIPDPLRFAVLGLLILALGPLDRNLAVRGLVPAWFGRFRLGLSLGAGAALFLAALA